MRPRSVRLSLRVLLRRKCCPSTALPICTWRHLHHSRPARPLAPQGCGPRRQECSELSRVGSHSACAATCAPRPDGANAWPVACSWAVTVLAARTQVSRRCALHFTQCLAIGVGRSCPGHGARGAPSLDRTVYSASKLSRFVCTTAYACGTFATTSCEVPGRWRVILPAPTAQTRRPYGIGM